MTNDDITLPVKRTTGQTLQDRLTTNAYQNILPSRYLLCDETGEPTESVDDIFRRVAENVAVAEAVHVDEEILIDTYHLKPDHPRRSELFFEVLNGLDDAQVPLSEANAKWVSYDRLMSDDSISEATREHVERTAEEFQEQMEQLSFIPNSPTLMNAGGELQQLSACFVTSPGDDIKDIHEKVGDAAEIFQSGGGVGYAFSYLRPYGDAVGSTGGIASGPITFMRTFDQMCETIAQGGTRRGAQMGIMRVSHPDVLYFIHAKNKAVSLAETLRLNDPDDYTYTSFGEALEEARGLIDEDGRVPKHLRNAVEGHLSNFNISVTVTDEFMEKAKAGEEFTMINPRTGEAHIASAETEEMYGWFGMDEYVTPGEPLRVPADELLDRIVQGAHENGEPGVIFVDRCNDDHSFPVESTPTFDVDSPGYEINSTNPCGEQPLMEYEACNLGHINLSTLVADDAPHWQAFGAQSDQPLDVQVEQFLDRALDWDEFDERIAVGTRFLDNVVTMSAFPIEQITETVRDNRKIGLGIMGLAQLYVQLGVRYGSAAGNEIARQVMTHINHESKAVSHELAQQRGCFANWEDSKYARPDEHAEWILRQTGLNVIGDRGFPIRNHNTTTIAPTGTTSMIGNTTGGCEPMYNVAYYKNVSDDVQGDEMLVEFDDYFLRVLEANAVDVDAVKQEAQEQMAANEFDGVEGLETVPDAIGELFVTSGDLSAKEHASVQCALQKGVDSAISKTCNFPHSASREDVEEVVHYLFEHGAKGATIYRDGTRSKQVLTTRADNTEFAEGDVADMDDEEQAALLDQLVGEMGEGQFYEFLREVAESMDWDQRTIREFITELRGEIDGEAPETRLSSAKRDRPDTLRSDTQRIETGYGSLYVTISQDAQGEPFELFTNIGNNGSTVASFTEAIAKTISIALRSGTDPEDLANTLQGIKSPKVAWDDGRQIHSIPDAIGVAMQRWLDAQVDEEELAAAYQEQAAADDDPVDSVLDVASAASISDDYYPEEPAPDEWMEAVEEDCPDCHAPIERQEGCEKCSAGCGWSRC